jgi:hypothetical protein
MQAFPEHNTGRHLNRSLQPLDISSGTTGSELVRENSIPREETSGKTRNLDEVTARAAPVTSQPSKTLCGFERDRQS